jgi:hypothetical protein
MFLHNKFVVVLFALPAATGSTIVKTIWSAPAYLLEIRPRLIRTAYGAYIRFVCSKCAALQLSESLSLIDLLSHFTANAHDTFVAMSVVAAAIQAEVLHRMFHSIFLAQLRQNAVRTLIGHLLREVHNAARHIG